MSEEVKAVRYKDHTKTKKIVIPIAVAAVFAFLSFYLVLPAINIFNSGFWGWLLSIIVVYLVSAVTCDLDKGKFDSRDAGKRVRYPFYLLLVIIAVLVIGSISSAKIFNARRYAGLIRVNTADFKDDMPETTNVNNIALMDTASASIIGNRTLGSLSQVVSQYVISSTYSQINYHDTPKKVANLEYADFFK